VVAKQETWCLPDRARAGTIRFPDIPITRSSAHWDLTTAFITDACCFDDQSTVDGYWLLRRNVAVLNTGEFPLQFRGPDAERLLNRLFTKDISKVRTGRCGYGLACYEDGGLLVDGILLRLEDDCFWYARADGDFYSWARAHAVGMDVEISDPEVYVSQAQGPKALDFLAAACDDGMPEPFGYFGIAREDSGVRKS